MATDGNKQFSITVNDGANYITGGTLGEDQYYPTLQITVEEDDGNSCFLFNLTTCNILTHYTQICYLSLEPIL